MKFVSRFCALALVLGCVTSSALAAPAAQTRFVVVADDFEPQVANITRLDENTIEFSDEKTGAPRTLPLARLVRLEAVPTASDPNAKPAAPTGFMLLLRDGQRWIGTPGSLGGDDLEWRGGELFGNGNTTATSGPVPLKAVAAIAQLAGANAADLDRASSAAAPSQDELILTNGDTVGGVISSSDGNTIICAATDGTPVAVEWANVRLARLAMTGAADAAASTARYRLALRDGRVIDGDRLALEGDHLTFFTARGGRLSVGDDAVVSIDHRGGRVKLLADVAPAERSYAPYFPSRTATDRATIAPPLVIAGRTLRSSILARPRTSLRWTLDGTSKTFVTRYVIPEGKPLADVTLRVKLDDAVAFERAHVRAGPLSELLKLPLGNAKSITLEVDFGDTYDVQDDLYWVDPALFAD